MTCVFIPFSTDSNTNIFGGYGVRNVSFLIGSVSLSHAPPEFHCPPLEKDSSTIKTFRNAIVKPTQFQNNDKETRVTDTWSAEFQNNYAGRDNGLPQPFFYFKTGLQMVKEEIVLCIEKQCQIYFPLPEMGSRITPEEHHTLHRIYIGINPSSPCCQSFPKGLNNIQFIVNMSTFLVIFFPVVFRSWTPK